MRGILYATKIMDIALYCVLYSYKRLKDKEVL